MHPVLALSVIVTLLSTNGIVRTNTSPIFTPQESNRNHQLDLALQREKYQLGSIGCTFSDSVCDPSLEYCFNDHAFGKCVGVYGRPADEDLLRYNLKKEDVLLLEKAMEELFEKGFRWGHSYTQCVLQNLLQGIRERVAMGRFKCIEDPVEEEVKTAILTDSLDGLSLEYLQEPSNLELELPLKGQLPIRTDQIEIPRMMEGDGERTKGFRIPTISEKDLAEAMEDIFLEDYLDMSQMDGNSEFQDTPAEPFPGIRDSSDVETLLQPQVFTSNYNTPEGFRTGMESRDGLEFLNNGFQSAPVLQKTHSDLSSIPVELSDDEVEAVEELMTELDEAAKEDQVASEVEEALKKRQSRDEIPPEFLEAPIERDDYNEDDLMFLNPKRFLYEGMPNGPDEREFEYELGPDLRPSGFERRERLDVKKPGPLYRTVNNFAFDKPTERRSNLNLGSNKFAFETPTSRHLDQNPEFGGIGPADMKIRDTSQLKVPEHNYRMSEDQTDSNESEHEASPTGSNDQVNQLVNLIKKADSPSEASKLAEQLPGKQLEIIDTSYVTVRIALSGNKIGSWNLAKDFVGLLVDLLDISHSTFQKIRMQDNNVITFKVGNNDRGLTASQVAKRIEMFKPDLERELDIRILSAVAGVNANSIRDSIPQIYDSESEEDAADEGGSSDIPYESTPQFPSSEPLFQKDGRNKNTYLAVFAVCGVVAAILVASCVVYVIRSTTKSREKLAKLSQDDPAMESCKDYQELCRARMASKSNEKAEPIRAVQRVQSNASDGGTSSSRSSTSSWSEEPVLSNMDISTGHMVLSYMEDHLKKKDRLDKEWAALCTYEADPGSTSIGQKPENIKRNRYTNSLPYDHSRVILNDLANVAGADYINASTITDHDPRNPAYIATQGPLPNTAADFWQMVWEQGSVVIVTLTRLAENGTTLCHRYWPEEGSELHHIYEVHLVSEHIWCEEYLVRSFYLKNLKTGETRTVTQFHFLAWPENGIPTSAKSLLEFRRKVNKSYRGRSCPIIVHCSDGAGRSGTYCLIDMVLNRMTKGAKEIDIAASLEHIRDQRPGMVRTKQQFEFVLMAVAEEVHAILKALPQ